MIEKDKDLEDEALLNKKIKENLADFSLDENIYRFRELTPKLKEQMHTDQFRNLVNPNRDLHVGTEDYDVYCDSLSKEMYAENMIMVEIGHTLLPMLLGFIDPEKYKDSLVLMDMAHDENYDPLAASNRKTYIPIIENFILQLRNMIWQRETHERVLQEISAYLKEEKSFKMKYDQLFKTYTDLGNRFNELNEKYFELEEKYFEYANKKNING